CSSFFSLEIHRKKGVVLERWDGIDGYLIEKLLEDPRFPMLPTYVSYTPIFSEPVNWGDNYGSRIRGYFVPKKSGQHVFFIASDNGGQLFLSVTDNPDEKILIARVGKDHESLPMQFRKYPEQQSYPINMKNGSYYYIEALHKEQYGNDSLAVAVMTPDFEFLAPIPSDYLWTLPPPKPHVNDSASSFYLVKIAAKAGARAGATLGVNEALKSGAKAGALAGAAAGTRAGAQAGAEAAREAATEVATKTLKEALSKLGTFQKPTFNIYAANGSVIPLTPGSVSSSGQTTSATGSIGIGTASAVEGSQTSQINQTGLTGQTSQPGEGGVGASISATITAGTQGATNSAAAGHSGVFHGAYVYNREKPYYIPPPGDNSHIIARKMVYLDPRGLSRVLVNGALYVIHSFDVPASQNPIYNLCWRITNGKLELTQNCQAFAIKIPGFDKGTGEHQTISFESMCLPGHYIRQKNYRFVLGHQGDTKFDYDASAAFFQVFSLPGAFQFSLMRKGWYICRSINRNYHRTEVVTDYNMASSEWLKRCSFALRPLAANENPLMNCYDTIEPSKPPSVASTDTKPPLTNKTTIRTTRPTTVPTTPHKDYGPCVNFTFWNTAGVPFILYSSLKPEGYLVTGPKLHLHYVIRDQKVIDLKVLHMKRTNVPNQDGEVLSEVMDELTDTQQLYLDKPKLASRQIVSFWAKDPEGKREILLDGKKIIYAIPGLHCWHYIEVKVTSRPKHSPSTTKPTTRTTTVKPTTQTPRPATTKLPPPPPPPPPPPRIPHIHVHFHPPHFPPPPKPTHPPPPPPILTPLSTKPTEAPPPPSTPSPPTPPTTKTTPCNPGVSTTTSRPCSIVTTPTTKTPPKTIPPCTPNASPPPAGSPQCKPINSTFVISPCSAGSPLCFKPFPSVTLPTLPPAPSLSPVLGCMSTHGGTSKGACCVFPFIYRGNPQHRCTRAERGYRWCSTTNNYDKDKEWGFCAACFLCYGGSSNGNCCHFPFVYDGKMYTTCTTQDSTKPWCATTYNYDVDKQWGYCGGDAPGSVSQPKIAYAPCSADCDGKCVDTCPDYCCVKGMIRTQEQPAPVTPPPPQQVEQVPLVQQTSQSCPAICTETCAPDCPVRCCNFLPSSPYMASPPQRPTNCPPICFNTCVSYCPTDCCNNPQQGVSRNTLSYTLKLPCPTNCYPTCHGNCPQQCCKAAQKGTSSLLHSAVNNKGVGFYQRIQGEGISPSMSLQTPSASPIVIRSTLLCPKVCNKICTNACPTECCKRQKNGNINQQKWRNTAQDCKNGAITFGGNAKGACCNFPFIYDGAVYWRCTNQNADKKWCSVTKVFELDRKWGYCPW
ncbi:unnamed protein product, partial [Pocillopora meandrina]